MIEVQQIADFLNTELNNISKLQGYNFDIKAEVGKRTNKDAIYGIVTTTKADARVDENVDYVFAVELSVPSAQSNENVIKVEKIIGEFKNKFHMKNRAFGGGQGTLLISLATPKDYQIKYVVGDDVPLVFTITTEYIRNAVGSGDKHWLLNGMEIPFISESVSVQKEGRTNTIHGESYTKTLLTRQTRYYKFNFDYDNSELCIMLKKDLLDGKYDKVYTLTYYDGVSFTKEQPFTTSVSIFANGVSNSKKPNVSEFDITFTDVDNEEEAEYFMALIDNPFDSTTENTRYFYSQDEQKVYYQNKIDNDIRVGGVGCQFVKIKAPNLSSIDITNQVYEIPLNNGEPIYDVVSVTNKNYAIIKVVKGEDEQWFYYYVSNQNIGGQNQVMFDLKLDSVQTYYFNPELKFGECLIEKGHLDRWIDNGDGTVSFDGTVDSKLFEREDIQNVAKRLVKRTKVNIYNTGNTEVDKWLNENVLGWIYLYTSEQALKFFPLDGSLQTYEKTLKAMEIQSYANQKNINDELNSVIGIYSPFVCLAFPVFINNYKNIRIQDQFDTTREVTLYTGGLEKFLKENSIEKIYALKFSTYPPFTKLEEVEIVKPGTVESLIIKGFPSSESTSPQTTDSINIRDEKGFVLEARSPTICIHAQKAYLETEFANDTKYTFNISEIINSKKNAIYNPKLLNSDYSNLSISDSTENGFEYDLQKLNKNNLKIWITEPLVPDTTKKYIRFANLDGVYTEQTKENLIGFVSNNDTTLSLTNTQYKAMLANNKNFFLQNSINRAFNLGQGMLSSGIAAAGASSNPIALAGAAVGAINVGANFIKSIINENLTIDNLKNAPDIIQGAKGNVFFENMYSENGIIIEKYDILPNEKEIINDYMCKYGFTVNRFGNPKEYDNIRHYYNYVKAQIDSISGIAISNAARDDIRQRFMNGVRFWKQDNIDYSMENYEEWLTDMPPEYQTRILWSQGMNDIIIAHYNGKQYDGGFYAEKSGIITFEGINTSIFIESVESDGTTEITMVDNYKSILTYENATYVTLKIN